MYMSMPLYIYHCLLLSLCSLCCCSACICAGESYPCQPSWHCGHRARPGLQCTSRQGYQIQCIVLLDKKTILLYLLYVVWWLLYCFCQRCVNNYAEELLIVFPYLAPIIIITPVFFRDLSQQLVHAGACDRLLCARCTYMRSILCSAAGLWPATSTGAAPLKLYVDLVRIPYIRIRDIRIIIYACNYYNYTHLLCSIVRQELL